MDFPDAVKIDPDEIKKMLPEYARRPPNAAASFTHEESSYLATRARNEALTRRAHVIVDAVGDSSVEKVRGKVKAARDAGYSVHGRYVTVPTEEAQRRAVERGRKSGRVVPPEVIAESHAGVSRVFPQVMGEFDTAQLFDNSTEWTPVLSTARGAQPVVHDAALWQQFRAKG